MDFQSQLLISSCDSFSLLFLLLGHIGVALTSNGGVATHPAEYHASSHHVVDPSSGGANSGVGVGVSAASVPAAGQLNEMASILAQAVKNEPEDLTGNNHHHRRDSSHEDVVHR